MFSISPLKHKIFMNHYEIQCSFNDRIRDAILGGSPFGHPLQQGFATGLLLQVFSLFSYGYFKISMKKI